MNGEQPLNYEASDNSGVKAVAQLGGARSITALRLPPSRAVPQRARPDPGGHLAARRRNTAACAVDVTDSASNVADFPAAQPARIDRTPPGAVARSSRRRRGLAEHERLLRTLGEPGRERPCPDRQGALLALSCRRRTNACEDERSGDGIASLADLAVPTMGEWRLRMWREDQAGNQQAENASLPVTLRHDGERPELGFEPTARGDPTRLAAPVTDKVSGLAGGQIEISRAGLEQLAAADDRHRGQPAGGTARRQPARTGQLRRASLRPRPGRQPGLHRPATRWPANDHPHPAARDDLAAGGRRGQARRRRADAVAGGASPCVRTGFGSGSGVVREVVGG